MTGAILLLGLAFLVFLGGADVTVTLSHGETYVVSLSYLFFRFSLPKRRTPQRKSEKPEKKKRKRNLPLPALLRAAGYLLRGGVLTIRRTLSEQIFRTGLSPLLAGAAVGAGSALLALLAGKAKKTVYLPADAGSETEICSFTAPAYRYGASALLFVFLKRQNEKVKKGRDTAYERNE